MGMGEGGNEICINDWEGCNFCSLSGLMLIYTTLNLRLLGGIAALARCGIAIPPDGVYIVL